MDPGTLHAILYPDNQPMPLWVVALATLCILAMIGGIVWMFRR